MIRSELDVLLDKIDDASLRESLRTQIDRLKQRRSFGLVFEQHLPERVRLPQRPRRIGSQVVRRDDDDSPTWEVVRVEDGIATLSAVRDPDGAYLRRAEHGEPVLDQVAVDDLVVISDFGEQVLPGLRHLGSVERGGDKPYHVVIKGENHHALEALRFTHAGKIDCIYIDPPYNSGARDWKYNNDYVDSNDAYRHSKWLAFMERRLKLARELLNPENSVLIVTIDENEHERLGMLLRQTFASARIQMVSITINPKGATRVSEFTRVDEYAYFVMTGTASVASVPGQGAAVEVRWRYLRRTDIESARGTKKGGPRAFYPIYVRTDLMTIAALGEPLAPSDNIDSVPARPGCVPVFPIADDGTHMNWGLTAPSLQKAIDQGFVRVTPSSGLQQYTVAYLTEPNIRRIDAGDLVVTGNRPDGSKFVVLPGGKASRPTTAWRETAHEAGAYGTTLLKALLPTRSFPFPKSLYAVEDTLRYFVIDKPDAVVLDFFAGSGTTAHAVARLNKQDGGRRQSIMVTNNEVSADEAKQLRERGLRPGDPQWEALGIFEHITRPRVEAAITGKTPVGTPIVGDYKFTDEFPMADGFEENAAFFELRYPDPDDVDLGLAFENLAPLLWLRAGGAGPIATDTDAAGAPLPFTWTDHYGILFETDSWRRFVNARPGSARTAFIVTHSPTVFAGIVAELPTEMSVVRIPDALLSMFLTGRGPV